MRRPAMLSKDPMRLTKWALIPIVLATVPRVRGGDLDPPPGPIMSTMKNLVEIEPRVVLNSLAGDATATHVISQPGNYYQTGDIQCEAGKSCVRIAALPPKSRVSIDGNGFAMIGAAGGASVHGINADGMTIPFDLGMSVNIIGVGGKGIIYTTGASGPGAGGTYVLWG